MTQVLTRVSGSTGRAAKAAIVDMYPLSPLQEGILFHSLYQPEDDMYAEQIVFTLEGQLDEQAFIDAWQFVIDRHSALRSIFLWEGLHQPVQVVCQNAPMPVEQLDWRDRSQSNQENLFSELLQADSQKGIALDQAPLMRLTTVRVDDYRYRCLWTHHHILMDGWSLPRLFSEIFTVYQSYCEQTTPQLKAVQPYRKYIDWLAQRDFASTEQFWRDYLSDFNEPTTFLPELQFKPPDQFVMV
ncbi:MAG: hypothetical protein HC828_00005 [Blastochloris sp.]|nr:hypothetical protein [Blastochloris sp.]